MNNRMIAELPSNDVTRYTGPQGGYVSVVDQLAASRYNEVQAANPHLGSKETWSLAQGLVADEM